MLPKNNQDQIDYLVIGHITNDVSETTKNLGGTASYSALTARAMGFRAGIISSYSEETDISPLDGIPIINYPSDFTTTFHFQNTNEGRILTLLHKALSLNYHNIPETWRNASIIHLGPLDQEIEPSIARYFNNSFIGITPQGWLRRWDQNGRIYSSEWPEATFILPFASACVVSNKDVNNNEERIEEMASSCHILAVTEGNQGARVFWNGDVRRFHPISTFNEVDTTGAGDIFATAFFIRLYDTHDAWEAARFATQIASHSIKRAGLKGIPTAEEISECTIEVY